MRDNWAVGYSRAYTVGVWVGNASGAPMWDVSGTSGAAPVWAAVMHFLHARQPSRAPAAPPGVVRQAVAFGSTEAAREEWFVQGTQQQQFAMHLIANGANKSSASGLKGLKNSPARITRPATGTIFALDPDIPPNRQRVDLQADGHGQGLHWWIDGKALARGPSAQWLPWPGRHVVQIRNAQGAVLDSVRLEVRGAGVR
jgi:penicillin-binding protein 1C